MKFNLFEKFNLLENDQDDFLIKKISKLKLALFLESFRFSIHIAWCANIYKHTLGAFDQYVFMILRGKKMIQMFNLLYKFPNSPIYNVIKKWESRFPIFIDNETNENSLIIIQPRAPVFISKYEPGFENIVPSMSIDTSKFDSIIYKWEFLFNKYFLKSIKGSLVNNIDEMPTEDKKSVRKENYNLEHLEFYKNILEDVNK